RKAVVTSKEVRFTKIILEHFGIAGCFDAIVGGDTTPARKPDPRPVIEAVRLLRDPTIDPANAGVTDSRAGVVMVGDSENDINAGRGAGTRTCAVTFGFRTAAQLLLASPDVIIDRFEQLMEAFC
ncbi:MAG: HAD hydrolase-like protein, partial [Blastocatellia bacterium]